MKNKKQKNRLSKWEKRIEKLIEERRFYSFLRISTTSLGERTDALEFIKPLSPENIGHLAASESATYCESFSCGEISLALLKNIVNSSAGMNVTWLIMNLSASPSSSLVSLVNFSILDSCFFSSCNKNSGAIKSNLPNLPFNSKTLEATPLLINEEIITLTSTTSFDIFYLENCSYLFDKDLFISSDNSSACSCVSWLLDTTFLNFSTCDNLSLMNLVNNMDNSILDTSLSSDFKSSGILKHISSMDNKNIEKYINLSDYDKRCLCLGEGYYISVELNKEIRI